MKAEHGWRLFRSPPVGETAAMPLSAEGLAALNRARAAYQEGNYELTLTEAQRAILDDPTDGRHHALFAAGLMGLERYAEAQATVEKALAHSPGEEWLHRIRSNALRAQGQYEEALAAALELLKLRPNEGISHYTLGLALYVLGRRGEAREALERAISLRPDYADAYLWLGEVELRSRDLASAERWFQECLRLNPNHARALGGLARVRLARQLLWEAAALFERALALDPLDPSIREDALEMARQQLDNKKEPFIHIALMLGVGVLTTFAIGKPVTDGLVVGGVPSLFVPIFYWLRVRHFRKVAPRMTRILEWERRKARKSQERPESRPRAR
jgi:tetratricopeptide (TPR) repeat protein